ncbi:oxygenase MpaB family protein [Synechococcus sp. PCC 6312]|uniref:oxygenase MpaB family protein n=1 Tax=Synechococcus sp. (strain ATCC 27167 / PCC 6312) TaxID=195253 RepID=UPI00029F402A|nr:oxygenase MpaB family protein [Synechococcus sp. PCC 6312]AFY62137.1 hypothetical protein Syn6312_3085 [Synechococcus sp. PCC 6312]
MTSKHPYYRFDEALEEYGSQAIRCKEFLFRGDPLADEAVLALAKLSSGKAVRTLNSLLNDGRDSTPDAPDALKALFDQLESLPLWVDWERIEIGSQTIQRLSLLVAPVLSLYSLPLMYASPAGTKPLVFTGNFVDRAPRRLAETSRFVRLTCQSGGLRRFSEGFKLNVKVRLMHAQVRRLLQSSGQWHREEMGIPVNQCHMAVTLILLSLGVIKGLRDLGVIFTQTEVEGVLLLWAYSGYISGVDPEFLCTSETQAESLLQLLLTQEGFPNEDSRLLVQALRTMPLPTELAGAPWFDDVAATLSRSLLGDQFADSLEIPASEWTWVVPLMRPIFSIFSEAQRYVPGMANLATSVGTKTWETMESALTTRSEPIKSSTHTSS